MEIKLPKLGFSMNEGVLAEWLVADGAAVSEGQPIYTLESDKAAEEIPSPSSGTIRILKPAGATYEAGTVVAEISS